MAVRSRLLTDPMYRALNYAARHFDRIPRATSPATITALLRDGFVIEVPYLNEEETAERQKRLRTLAVMAQTVLSESVERWGDAFEYLSRARVLSVELSAKGYEITEAGRRAIEVYRR